MNLRSPFILIFILYYFQPKQDALQWTQIVGQKESAAEYRNVAPKLWISEIKNQNQWLPNASCVSQAWGKGHFLIWVTRVQRFITRMEMFHFHWGTPVLALWIAKRSLEGGGGRRRVRGGNRHKTTNRGCCSSWLCRAPLRTFCCCRLLVLVASWCCNCSWLMPGSGKTKLQKQQQNILLNTHWKWQPPTSAAPSAWHYHQPAPLPHHHHHHHHQHRTPHHHSGSLFSNYLLFSRSLPPTLSVSQMLHVAHWKIKPWKVRGEVAKWGTNRALCPVSSTFQGFLFWPKSPKIQKPKPHTRFTE